MVPLIQKVGMNVSIQLKWMKPQYTAESGQGTQIYAPNKQHVHCYLCLSFI